MKKTKSMRIMPGGRRCAARKRDGTQCRGWATRDSVFCICHNPAKAAEMNEARSRGGSSNRKVQLPAHPPRFPMRSSRDVVAAGEWIFNELIQGSLGSSEAYAAISTLTVVVKALDLQAADRIEAVGEAVSRPRPREGLFDLDAIIGPAADEVES